MQIRQCGAILAEKGRAFLIYADTLITASQKMGAPPLCHRQFGAQRFASSSSISFSLSPLPLLLLPLLSNLVSLVSTFVSPAIHCFSLICIHLCCIRLSHQSTDCPHYASSANLDFAHNAGLCVFGGLDGRRRCAARKCSS